MLPRQLFIVVDIKPLGVSPPSNVGSAEPGGLFYAYSNPGRWRLLTWAIQHLEDKDFGRRELYRIFYYDCPPITKKVHHPLTKRAIDFSKRLKQSSGSHSIGNS